MAKTYNICLLPGDGIGTEVLLLKTYIRKKMS